MPAGNAERQLGISISRDRPTNVAVRPRRRLAGVPDRRTRDIPFQATGYNYEYLRS